MRILFARRDSLSRTDGINSFLYAIIEALISKGHEVHLAGSASICLPQIQERFPCRHYPHFWTVGDGGPYGWKKDMPIWFRHWPEVVRQVQPDRIVVNGVIPRWNSVPTLGINHDLENRGGFWFARLVRIIGYRLVQDRLATCTELRDALARNILMPSRKIGILPTCLRVGDFHPEIYPKLPFLLHIGTAPYKHPEKSIAALGLIRDPSVRLLITGPVHHNLVDTLRNYPTQIQRRIDLPGILPAAELRKNMASASAVLVPSEYEIPVLSPTVLEAFASSAVVITTPSISRDLIEPGTNCLAARGPAETAFAVEGLLQNKATALTLGRQALQRAKFFDSSVVADRLLDRLAAKTRGVSP